MRARFRRFHLVRLTLLICAAGFMFLIILSRAEPADSPEALVRRAWELAQASGSYQFSAEIDQTTRSAPSLSAAGRGPRHDHLVMAGMIDQPGALMELELQRGGTNGTVAMRVDHGRAYGRQGVGAWREVDNAADVFAPAGDPLGFLAGASNVQDAGSETRQFGDDAAGLTFTHTRYSFDFDGTSFIDRLGEQLAEQMRLRGQLPPGLNINTAAYREMRGQGELWIDSDGLPRRMVLQIELPQQQNGDRVSADLTIDYLAFDRAQLAVASTGLLENPVAWADYRISTHAAALRQLGLIGALFLAAALIVVAVARRMRRERAYTLVVGVVIISMLAVPQLQAHTVAAFFDTQRQQQADAEQERAKVEQSEQARETLQTNTWNPHAGTHNPGTSAALENAPATQPGSAAPFALQMTPSLTTADSDGDGLSDADEEYWGSCPSASSGSEYCDDVVDPTDSDADGLGDGVEVHDLATLPNQWDSDGDSITDTLEIKGFVYKSQTWYLDAYSDDTNKDGLIDGVECEVWLASSDLFNPNAACPDTDGDGTPDAFDNDNDGDGVPDNADTSPNATLAQTFSNGNPLLLSISDLELNKPVYVDIQLRTSDLSHLNYYGTVLNWPSGDTSGQIMRNLDTTFAAPANLALASGDANAANGDVRMVPMLEVTIPYGAGHYGNLPVTSTYQLQPRPSGLPVDSWVDSAILDAYGINVNDADTSATDLIYYAPLNPVTDQNGGGRVALASRLYYEPNVGSGGVATWGSAHQVRLVWMIQMLTDTCTDAADSSTCTESMALVHVYDDTWKVAGINVSEQHGVDVAIVYEDPAEDENLKLDSEIWSASWNLSNTFLSGRDCDSLIGDTCVSNGERDVTVANLASSISGWAGGAANTDLAVTEVFTYTDEAYISSIMSEETPALLNDIFADYAGATVPTLLFAQENTTRGINLDGVAGLGTNQPALSFAGSTAGTNASMSWAPYQYVNGDWQNYDTDEYLTYLQTQISGDIFFQPEDSSESSADEAEGKQLWASSYFITLVTGVSEYVEADGVPTWYQNRVIDQSLVTPGWPASTTYGFTYIGFSVLFSLIAAVPALKAAGAGNYWSAIKQAFSNEFSVYSFKFSELFQSGWIKNMMNATLAAATVVVAAAAVMFAIGYLTGNNTLLDIAIFMLNVVTIVVVGLFLANLIFTSTLTLVTTAVSTHLAKFKAVGPIGLVLGVVAIWGMFIYQMTSMGINPGSVSFNLALSRAIAASLVIIGFFFLELAFPVVGAAIVMIIFIIDAILALLGKSGIQEWMAAKIGEAIYDLDFVVANMDSSDRLDFDVTNLWLANPDAGFVESNKLYYSMDITNTIKYDPAEFSESEARDTSFRYDLKKDRWPIHTVAVGEMNGEWQALGGGKLRVTDSQTLGSPIQLIGLRTGVNRSLNGWLYLVEEFQLPYEGCWRVIVWEVECAWYSYHDYNPINLGQYQSFDILPDTIGQFAGMGWNNTSSLPFPVQKDLDGDGLLATSQGGSDPNDSKRDTDGDGIDDLDEQALGTNAALADTDGDGLTDREELAYDTDELDADTDNDGFSDYFELRQGWTVGYLTSGGTLLQTRVWPDPLSGDGDNDGISDMVEYRYGFNPRATNDLAELDNAVQFDSVEVNETIVPQLLLRFEESQGAQAFTDSSGVSDSVKCAGTTCPTAGAAGRYGSAISLDGSEYIPANSGVTEMARGSFSMAAWVKTTGTNMGIVTKSDGDGVWESGERSLYIDGSGKPTFVGYGNNYIVPWFAVNDGQWHHVAVTWEYDGSAIVSNGTPKMYIDGVDQTYSFPTNYLAFNADKTGDILYIGRGNNSEAPNNFAGALDEVAVFNRALSAAEVEMLKDGRYNANDLLVAPGAALTYQAVITNTNSTLGVSGHLVGATSGSNPVIGPPSAALRFEQSDRDTTFTNATGESSTATCSGESCPVSVSSRTGGGNAARFGSGSGNTDDFISLPSLVTDGDSTVSSYTVAFWLKLDSRPFNTTSQIFVTDSTGPGALSMEVYPDGQLEIAIQDAIDPWHYSNAYLATNTWYHILLTTAGTKTQLYINNTLDSEITHTRFNQFIVGPGRIGNSMDGKRPLYGTLDDLVFYNNKSATASAVNAIYNGTHIINQSAIGFYYPTLLLYFNDTGSVAFTNRMNDSGAACASATTCPATSASGIFGSAALSFDGTDDYLTLANEDFARGDYTIGAWFKTSAVGSEQSIVGATQTGTGNHGIYLSLQSTGTIRFLHRFPFGSGGGTSIYSSQSYNNGAWHYVTAVRKGSTLTLYVDGVAVGTGTDSQSLDKSLDVTIGRLSTTSAQRYFNGSLDEILIIPAAVDSEGAAALMESTAPFIDIAGDLATFAAGALSATTASGSATVSSNLANSEHLFTEEVEAALNVNTTTPVVDSNAASLAVYMPFEEIPGSTIFSNLVNSSRDATCSGSACPAAGLRTQSDRGLSFDGVEDRLRAEDTTATFNADSIAAWVKADRGTIVDLRSGNGLMGIQLDTNAFQLTVYDNSSYLYYSLPVNLTKNTWTHVAATFNRTTRVATVYINGAQSATLTIPAWSAGGSFSSFKYPSIGADINGGDYLHGYLDDLRIYKDLTLTAAQVQTLYRDSTPLMRFEFDESDGTTTFADKGPSAYVGQPTAARCASVSIDSLTPAALATSPSGIYVAHAANRLATVPSVTVGATAVITSSSLICEGESLEVGLVAANGTTTVIATQSVNVTTSGAASAVFASGPNSVTLRWTVAADPIYTYNPAPGADGKLGNGAVFNGSGAITIAGASTVNALTSAFTVMGWAKPEDVTSNTTQVLLSAGAQNSANGFGFGIYQKQLWFSNLSSTVLSGDVLSGSGWQHVAVVYDSPGQTVKFYVDGALKQTISGASVPAITANSDDNLYIGARSSSGGITNYLTGELDELAVYGRSLSVAEVASIYSREVIWFRTTGATTIRVDSDLPQIELLSDYTYRSLNEFQLSASAVDVSSSVTILDVGVAAPSGSTSWSSAPICLEALDINSTAAWCPTIDPTASGEGAYAITLRAIDLAGNHISAAPTTIYVDGTPPLATSPYIRRQRTVTQDPDADLTWSVNLAGTIGDPTLSDGSPSSGLITDTVMVQLIDELGAPVADGAQQATVSGATWSIDYQMTGRHPVGYYDIEITAEDQVGNRATTTVGSLVLDTYAPTVDLDPDTLPSDVISQTTIITGSMIDVPEPANAVAKYHFEPDLGLLEDSSGNNHAGGCTSCPGSTSEGLFGSTLTFNGALGNSVTVPATTSFELGSFTASVWIRPTWVSGSNGYSPAIFGIRGPAGAVFSLSLRDNYSRIEVYNGSSIKAPAVSIAQGAWHHIAIAHNGSQFTAYLDGLPISTQQHAIGTGTNIPLAIGKTNSAFSQNYFTGDIDEVMILDRVLSEEEIYALAQSGIAGAGNVQTALEPVDFDQLESGAIFTPTLDWEYADLHDPETKFSTWSTSIPSGLEDFYQLRVRGQDLKGYTSPERVSWRGVIDTLAPRVTHTARLIGQGGSAETKYIFHVDDLFLDPASLITACAGDVTFSTYTNPERINGASATCRVPGHVTTPATAQACDYSGHCTSRLSSFDPAIIIESPDITATVSAGAATSIAGIAYDPDGLQSVEVRINGVTLATIPLGGTNVEASWSTAWQPTSVGTYTITARMTDQGSNALTDTLVLEVQPPRYALAVSRVGSGTGTVGSDPAGINCGAEDPGGCVEEFSQGTAVTLTATPSEGSNFTGWSGDCTGTTLTCTVTMMATASVTATFTLKQYGLTVASAGTGSGSINSTNISGITCGPGGIPDCSEQLDFGTLVVLLATPATGSTFAGWSGGCTGTSPTCQVTMDQSRSVTATFATTRSPIFLPLITR